MGRMGEKTEVRISTILSCDHDSNAYNMPTSSIESDSFNRDYYSPHCHLLFYIGYLSRAFTLLILYPPYSLLESKRSLFVRCHTHLPFVVLRYRIPSLCYIICIHDLPSSAMFRITRGRKIGTNSLKIVAFLIAWKSGAISFFFTLPIFFLL